jgi:hypothetical protein
VANKRKSKLITDKELVDRIVNINTDEHLNRTYLMELFGDFDDKSKKTVNPYDIISIPAGSITINGKTNINSFTTTVGIWIYNKLVLEPTVINVTGYISNTLTEGEYLSINKKIAYAILEDRLTVPDYKRYIEYNEFMMPFASIISPNDSEELITLSSKLEATKNRLVKENKEAIAKGDVFVANKMEKELINKSMEILKDNEAMDSYMSGARGNINNHLKNTYMMKGATKDPLTGEFKVTTSNYADGISGEEYHIIANSMVEGAYARGNKTQIGGYIEKLFVAAFQHIKIGPKGSDCGTKHTIRVKLDRPQDWIYSYIVEGNKFVELTSENLDKYKGKYVNLRFSSMCKSKNYICERCAGTLFRRLNMENVGLALPAIPSKLKNLAMKSFHDSTKKVRDMDIEKAFGFDGEKEIK